MAAISRTNIPNTIFFQVALLILSAISGASINERKSDCEESQQYSWCLDEAELGNRPQSILLKLWEIIFLTPLRVPPSQRFDLRP